ncbi:MAG: hypothetical protein RLZZ28_929 [Bacteroidota bacterium]|jgi:hypothetical protein
MSNYAMPGASPRQNLVQDFGLGKITLNYARPSVQGRSVFQENSLLAPLEKLWRFGADAATQIQFSDTVTIAGTSIDPGTYLLFAIPHQTEWEIIFNSNMTGGVRGYDPQFNILSLYTPVQEQSHFTETLSLQFANIRYEACCLQISWAHVLVELEITTAIVERLRETYARQMESDTKPYFPAAVFNAKLGKDFPKAMDYVNKALESNPGAYYMHFLKAAVAKALGDGPAAKKSAEDCLETARKGGSDDYIRLAKDFLSKL